MVQPGEKEKVMLKNRVADGFDRSQFVLDTMDCNLLYEYRLVGDDVFTSDILWDTKKNTSVFEVISIFFATLQRKTTI